MITGMRSLNKCHGDRPVTGTAIRPGEDQGARSMGRRGFRPTAPAPWGAGVSALRRPLRGALGFPPYGARSVGRWGFRPTAPVPPLRRPCKGRSRGDASGWAPRFSPTVPAPGARRGMQTYPNQRLQGCGGRGGSEAKRERSRFQSANRPRRGSQPSDIAAEGGSSG
jgi:hypothetical protein